MNWHRCAKQNPRREIPTGVLINLAVPTFALAGTIIGRQSSARAFLDKRGFSDHGVDAIIVLGSRNESRVEGMVAVSGCFSMESSFLRSIRFWVVAVAMLSVGDVRGADDSRPWPTDSSPEATGGDLSGSVQPFENTLGMRFLSVPSTQVAFSIWDTRVQDYQVFARATSRDWPRPEFQQGPTHPAINVSWVDAKKFCEWLTQKERAAGKIRAEQEYRLPTDAEWSVAVGLPEEKASTPSEKSGRAEGVYPWGKQWPPPKGAGNYCDAAFYEKYKKRYQLTPEAAIKDYDDGYADTSPVGSFAANELGLYDMGGNVWQWCEDWYDNSQKTRVLRGASLTAVDPRRILSSFRYGLAADSRYINYGFRCVLTLPAPVP